MSVRDDLKRKRTDYDAIGVLLGLAITYILGCILYYVNVEKPGLVEVLVMGIISAIPWLLPTITISEAFGESLLITSLSPHPHDFKQRRASQAAIAITVYYVVASIMMLINKKYLYLIGNTLVVWGVMSFHLDQLRKHKLGLVKDEEEAEKRRREYEDEQRGKQLAEAKERNARAKIEKKENLLRQHGGYLPCEWCGKEVPESRVLCRDYGSFEDYFCSLKCLREFEDDLRRPRY